MRLAAWLLCCLVLLGGAASGASEPLKIATLNVRNYLVMDRVSPRDGWRPEYPKSEASKTALRAVIREVAPDFLCLQEMGPPGFLAELQRDLKVEGLDLPHALMGTGAPDNERHLAVLSRVAPASWTLHTRLDFAYRGGRAHVRRGLLEVAFGEREGRWHLFVVHLKSKYTERDDDPEAVDFRTGEARAIRDYLRARFPDPATARYLLAGDFNDHPASRPLARFTTVADAELTRPVPAADRHGLVWTLHWAKRGAYYTRDYFLATPGFWPAIVDGKAMIVDGPEMSAASDHRLLWLEITP